MSGSEHPPGGDPWQYGPQRDEHHAEGSSVERVPPGSGGRPQLEGARRAAGGTGLLIIEVAGGLLWAGASFLILYWVCQLLDLDERTWIVIGLWIASALVVLWKGSDELMARYLFGLRRPTLAETQRLTPSWVRVATRAGADPTRYTLWLQDGEAPTAVAGGGLTVSVTGWSLYTLPPSHLEAVLAHDLATHLRGANVLSRVFLWYAVPTRIVAVVVRQLLKLSRTIPAIGCTIVGFLMVSYFGIFLASLILYDGIVIPLLYLVPLFSPLLFIGVAKIQERLADRAVADLGYGRQLLEVFYGWQAQHRETSRRMGFAQPEWLAGQPSLAERIRALEVYAQVR